MEWIVAQASGGKQENPSTTGRGAGAPGDVAGFFFPMAISNPSRRQNPCGRVEPSGPNPLCPPGLGELDEQKMAGLW